MNIGKLTSCIFQYLPKGEAWCKEENPEILNLIKIIADEVLRLSQVFEKTEQSIDPRYAASELVDSWSKILSEPERSSATAENRNFLHEKYTNTRGQSEVDILYLPSQTSPNVSLAKVKIAKIGLLTVGQPIYQDDYYFTYIFDGLSLYDYGEGPELDRKAIDIIEKTKQAHCAALYYHNFYNRYQNVSD